MKKSIVLLFFVLIHTFIFSAENTDSRNQFLAMNITEAHTKYGNGKLGLDANSDYMQQQPKVEKILGKEKDTAEHQILIRTLKMIASDFKKQEFYMCTVLNPETQRISVGFLNFAQEEIAHLTIQEFKIMLLANNRSHIVSRQELNLFANLSPALQDKMRPYHYLYKDPGAFPRWEPIDHRIKIECRQKITQSNIVKEIFNNGHTFLLIFGLGSLLYTHYIIKPYWDSITGSPDLSIVARNSELEITNNLIDNLQKNNTAGAENLIKIALENPLKYTNSDYWHFIKSLLPIIYLLSGMAFATSHYTAKNDGLFIESLLFLTIVPFSLLLPSSIIPLTYYNFNNDLPSGLLTFTTSILALALIWRIKEDTQNFIKSSGWKETSIDFEENKTVKECIKKYLNDPNLEIK